MRVYICLADVLAARQKQNMAAKNGRDVNFQNMEYVDVDISKIGEAVCSSSDKRK